jgi:large exoprotein involved in heme utilization and adhesion
VDVIGAGSGIVSASILATGDAGNLTIKTGRLGIRDGGTVSTSSIGLGQGGNLDVTASDSVEVMGESGDYRSSLDTITSSFSGKPAGDLTIQTGRLSIHDGAEVSVDTLSRGSGGRLNVSASEAVDVIGASADGQHPSTLSAKAGTTVPTQDATGKAGTITINTPQLNVLDGAQVTARSQGLGDAGNLEITASSIFLDNRGKLTTETLSTQGGNITLNVQDLLLLRHNSEISTSAGTANQGGDGGNITINSPFIVAVPKEDSDITANAYTGRGGNINITTQGIYGLQFRPNRTPLSDITASSDFGVNGTVKINSAFDVTQSVTNLPIELVDASNQIDQTCSPRGAAAREGNRFVITGRGGLPPSPNEPLQGESVVTHWVTLDSQAEHPTEKASSVPNTDTMPAKPTLIEAQGWRYGANGEVILTASASTATPQSPSTRPAICQLK